MSVSEETHEKSLMGGVSPRVINDVKRWKTRCKSNFTKAKNKLLIEMDNDDVNRKVIRSLQDNFDYAQEELAQCFDKLCGLYQRTGDSEGEQQTMLEIDQMDADYTETHRRIQDELDNKEDSVTPVEKSGLGKDLWKQLKRVSIPTFNGDKLRYESWKAAFMACIDAAPASSEYKLLQLRQHLEGDALKCIESLGHSKTAYEFAKERLERKYGGTKRQVQLFLDQLDNFPVMKDENSANIEKFADILDIAVMNLTEAGKQEELGDGALYIRLQKKLPLNMLSRYHRWIHESESEESVESLRKWVLMESQFKTSAAETIFGLGHSRQRKQQTFYSNDKKKEQRPCGMCGGLDHHIWNCALFKGLPVNERWEKAKALSLCFRCLGNQHSGKDCKFGKPCGINNCHKTHNRLLHYHEAASSQSDNFTHTCSKNSSYIALRTVPLIVKNGEKRLQINALLDDGSTQTYVNRDVAIELGIKMTDFSDNIEVNVLNGKKQCFQTSSVNIGIESLNGQLNLNLEVNTIDNVTGNLQAVEVNSYTKKWEHLKGISFPKIGKHSKVDMLIGLDYSDLHHALHEIRGKPGEPVACLTPLGWTCVGNLEQTNDNSSYHTFLLHRDKNDINQTLQQFWEIEEGLLLEKDSQYSFNNKNILEKAEKSIIQKDGHYQINIPWKDNKNQLNDNVEMATKRLLNTEKRLNKQPELYMKYDQIFKDYEQKGYISPVKVHATEISQPWYIPHFPVIKPDRQTTKVRIVFDASAKYRDLSLNDAIHQGPPLQNDLFDILLRFRKNSVAVACDIQEMYLQIGIPESDRQYHRFLWRSSPEEEIKEYQFNRLVFGVNASPFLAQCVSQFNARKYGEEFPMAAETILNSTYMDDSIDSVKSDNEGVELYCQLSRLWGKAAMFARKWLSNSHKVLENIPVADRALDNNLLLDKSEKLSVKTLGVLWQANTDNFTFKSNFDINKQHLFISKRNFLSKVSTLYDPLGFLVPYIVRAKNLMQDVWLSGVEWDEELPPQLTNQAYKWFEELVDLSQIHVPRNLHFDESRGQIHTFVDASTHAYCAVTYICNDHVSGMNNNARFIASKSKVVPLKSISVPRLELMAAILGLKLSEKICKALQFDLNNVHFWSDSLNTLWWIRNQSRLFKPFVANRLGEIQSKTDPQQWRHVPTKLNPADIGSRGLSVKELETNDLWWKGPSFLSEGVDKWPENKFESYQEAKIEQKRVRNLSLFESK